MSKTSKGNNKCQLYLSSRTRINNKNKRLEKRLKLSTMKQEARDNVIKNSRIGRKKEGFTSELFKHSKKKV